MAQRAVGLQDQFLNAVRRGKTPVTIFLMKGVKLQGIITWFDSFSLLLRRDNSSQLLYKHAISTIMPAAPMVDLPAPAAPLSKKPMLQDVFLAAASRQSEPMTVFLVNGVMLQGSVRAYDQFCILLERGEQGQIVYKHAVSTLQPTSPLDLQGEHDDPEASENEGVGDTA